MKGLIEILILSSILIDVCLSLPPSPRDWFRQRKYRERERLQYYSRSVSSEERDRYAPRKWRPEADNLVANPTVYLNKTRLNSIAANAPLVFVAKPTHNSLQNFQRTPGTTAVLYAVQAEPKNTSRLVTSQTAFPAHDQRLNKGCSEGPGWEYPCVSEKTGNAVLSACCTRFNVPSQCQDMCNYNSDKDTIRELVVDKKQRLCLSYLSPIVYCASQNRDNTQCCKDLGFAELKNGNNCYKYCDPAGHNGIKTFASSDLVCAANWDVVMWCHRAGLMFEDPDRKYTQERQQPWKVKKA